MEVVSLSSDDSRRLMARVAGPAALLVAKMHKIAERQDEPKRLIDKDAHDAYRILVTIPTNVLAHALRRLVDDELAGRVTRDALTHLDDLFAAGPMALGSQMAGRSEGRLGDPAVAAASCAALAVDLLEARDRQNPTDTPTDE